MQSAQSSQSPPPPQRVTKLNRGKSCVLCQQRKVRCDQKKPCAGCVKAGVECRVVPLQPPRRRRTKPTEKELVSRIRKYEALLAESGVRLDSFNDDSRLEHDENDDELEGEDAAWSTPRPGDADGGPPIGGANGARPRDHWYPYTKEVRFLCPFSPSRQGSYQITTDKLQYKEAGHLIQGDASGADYIHDAFEAVYDSSLCFPFYAGMSQIPLIDRHPPGMQIFHFWQTYLTNVDPLLKVTHTPTLQKRIIDAASNLTKVPTNLEALMFSIYFISTVSMSEEEVQTAFGEDKPRVLSRLLESTQQALINAGFMRSQDLMVLQAYFLYLLCVRGLFDPRSLFTLVGIAVRVAQRLGLHRDGAKLGIAPLEVEQRRRLWWNIVALDKRVAEMSGASITAFTTPGMDCKRPLNINDSALHVSAKDAPSPSDKPTDMVFLLARIELSVTAAPNAARPLPSNDTVISQKSPPGEPVTPHPSPSGDVATVTDIERYSNYVENTYLRDCDTNIPLHLFALLATRQNLCKLSIVSNMGRLRGRDSISQHARDAIFVEAIRMVEYDNLMFSTESCHGFVWYSYMSFPAPAYIFLISELGRRFTGELCTRAWDAIIQNHHHRGFLRTRQSPLHFAFGSHFLRAWDGREAALAKEGEAPETPEFIGLLRNLVASRSSGQTGETNQFNGTAALQVPSAQYSQPPGLGSDAMVDPAMYAVFGAMDDLQGTFPMPMQLDGFNYHQMDWTALFPQY